VPLSTRLQLGAKRAIDVLIAATALVVLSPLLLLVAAIIKLESRGPAVFHQERLGSGGAPFTLYKFRTMTDGNDSAIHQKYVKQLITSGSEELKDDTGTFKLVHDPRVTRSGRVLRRLSIDELPQLLNVLNGEMSLVGPRPPLRYEAELYSARAIRRLTCTPGITGLWQVSGRCQTTFDEMVDLDLRYIDEWSLWLDVKILARTLPAVVGRKGAC
jgi:lipopolysaccharide/colanic/teichoic acid biosynthesis glycosyltransferase